jgi:hypothetical protein
MNHFSNFLFVLMYKTESLIIDFRKKKTCMKKDDNTVISSKLKKKKAKSALQIRAEAKARPANPSINSTC